MWKIHVSNKVESAFIISCGLLGAGFVVYELGWLALAGILLIHWCLSTH